MFKLPLANQILKKIILQNENSLVKQFQTNNPNNQDLYQVALYQNLSLEDQSVKYLGIDYDSCAIYGIYSYSIEKTSLSNLQLLIIKNIQQSVVRGLVEDRLFKGVTFIFFSQSSLGSQISKKSNIKPAQKPINFNDFQKVLKKLQIHYFFKINKIYLCHPKFWNNAFRNFFNFGIQNTLLEAITQQCHSLLSLVKQLGPLFYADLIDERVQSLQQNYDWGLLYSENDKVQAKMKYSKSDKKNSIRTFYKLKLSRYTLNQSHVPKILVILCELIQKKEQNYKSQGIFRIACNQQNLRHLQIELQKQLDGEENNLDLFQADAIATCIKKIFYSLSDPLLPEQLYHQIVEKHKQNIQISITQNKKSRIFNNGVSHFHQNRSKSQERQSLALKKKNLDPKLFSLNQTNFQTLLYLIRFFRNVIITKEAYNKMSSYNLAVIFSPIFFKPNSQYSLRDLSYSQRLVAYLDNLICKLN